MPEFNTVPQAYPRAEHIQQIIDALAGVTGAGIRIRLTALSDTSNYALDVRNLGTNGYGLRVRNSSSNTLLLANDAGVTVQALAGYIKGTAGVLSGQVGVPWADLTSVPSTFTPAAHASAHHSGGGDALTLSSIAGSITTGQHGSLGAIANAHAWADITKTGSNITDIVTRSHTSLSDIGTNTHATIDTHIAATGSSVHGLGTISTQASNSVSITGGSLSGLTSVTTAALTVTNGSLGTISLIEDNRGGRITGAGDGANAGQLLFDTMTASSMTRKLTIKSTGDVLPEGAGTQNLGNSSQYWADVSYKTLTDRGCLGWFDEGVEMPDGRILSDVQALVAIKKDATKQTVYGVPRLDYSTMPKAVYKPAEVGADGAETTALISIMLGAIKELHARIERLEE